MVTLSIIIPVYNSEQGIALVVEDLVRILPTLASTYEVILVDDGSADQSWQTIQRLVQQHVWVRGFQLMRNYGQHNALLCGIRAARYDLILTMDDDGQHPVEALPLLLAALTPQHDVVYGSPQQQQHGLFRDLASQVTKMVLQGAMGADNARNISALRIFRASLRGAFEHVQGPYVNLDVLLTWGTKRFTRITVEHRGRAIGQSNYTFGKLVTHTLNMVTGFSTLPLQAASILGFLLTLFGFLVLIYVVVVRLILFGEYVGQGFTFLASMIAIFAGAQMFTLGIMGEYLARMHFRLMDKPLYVVREEANSTENKPV